MTMLNIVSNILKITEGSIATLIRYHRWFYFVKLYLWERMAICSDQLLLYYSCVNPEIFPNISVQVIWHIEKLIVTIYDCSLRTNQNSIPYTCLGYQKGLKICDVFLPPSFNVYALPLHLQSVCALTDLRIFPHSQLFFIPGCC